MQLKVKKGGNQVENNSYADIIANPVEKEETPVKPKRKGLNRKTREGLIGYGFASLWLIGIALFTVYPLLTSFYSYCLIFIKQ